MVETRTFQALQAWAPSLTTPTSSPITTPTSGVSLVTDSALAPVAEFMANHVVECRCGTTRLPRAQRLGSGRPESIHGRIA
jgi:hypothetical protein